MVTFDMPYSVSGVTERNYHGTGLVVDAQRGLVVVDRNTVPVAVGDVRLTFAGTVRGAGHVVYVHPLHNLAVVAYDPKLLGTTPVQCRDALAPRDAAGGRARLGRGPQCAIASCARAAPRSRASIRSTLPLSRTMRFRDSNLEIAQLVNPPERVRRRARGRARGGCSACGRASPTRTAASSRRTTAACRSSWSRRCSTACARGRAAAFARGGVRRACRWRRRASSACRRAGCSASRSTTASRRQVLTRGAPGRRLAGRRSCCSPGDLLLAIDGNVVTRFREVERAVADKRAGAGDRLARRGRADARGADRRAAGQRRRARGAVGRAPRCRRRIVP